MQEGYGKRIASAAAIAIVSLLVIWGLASIARSATAKPVISESTAYSVYMTNCVDEAVRYLDNTQAKNYCECTWDGMKAIHGDKFYQNEKVVKSVVDKGFSSKEEDMLTKCVENVVFE